LIYKTQFTVKSHSCSILMICQSLFYHPHPSTLLFCYDLKKEENKRYIWQCHIFKHSFSLYLDKWISSLSLMSTLPILCLISQNVPRPPNPHWRLITGYFCVFVNFRSIALKNNKAKLNLTYCFFYYFTFFKLYEQLVRLRTTCQVYNLYSQFNTHQIRIVEVVLKLSLSLNIYIAKLSAANILNQI